MQCNDDFGCFPRKQRGKCNNFAPILINFCTALRDERVFVYRLGDGQLFRHTDGESACLRVSILPV
jgi:hypothetical protein